MIAADDKYSSHDNNFNLLRCIAASAVIVSHSWPLALGERVREPLSEYLGFSLGHLAVYIFFVISGFLISMSYARRPYVFDFLAARALRIAPALIVVLLLTVLLLGPTVTSLELREYWENKSTHTYFPRNLSLAFLQYELPGVFVENPYRYVINGSLWTLVHEVMCYSVVLVGGLAGVLHSKRLFAMLSALFLVVYFTHDWVLPQSGVSFHLRRLLNLGFAFWLGMLAFMFRDRIRLKGAHALGMWVLVLVTARFSEPLFHLALLVAVAYSTLCIAYSRSALLLQYNKVGDYSYGLYIYAFPVQQLIVYLTGMRDPVLLAISAFLATLPLAMLSWHIIEQPVLNRKKMITRGLKSWFGLPVRAA